MSIIFISLLSAVLFLSSSFTETIIFTLLIGSFISEHEELCHDSDTTNL